MNNPRLRLFATLAVSVFLASFAWADEDSYVGILKERDAVLTQILAQREARHAIGTVPEEDVLSARLALWSFRRDTAASTSEKIKQQELIVDAWQKRLNAQKARTKSGMASDEDILIATDSVLQARQVLEELQIQSADGQIPDIEVVSIKAASFDRPGDVRVMLKISNRTPKTFHYRAREGVIQPVGIVTQTKINGRWESPDQFVKGFGLYRAELKANAELTFEVTPFTAVAVGKLGDPAPQITYPVRFQFLWRLAAGGDAIASYTRECMPEEFVSQQ